MKYLWKNRVDELLRRAGVILDRIAKDGSDGDPAEDAQIALANITLATALMQYEATYPSRPNRPDDAV